MQTDERSKADHDGPWKERWLEKQAERQEARKEWVEKKAKERQWWLDHMARKANEAHELEMHEAGLSTGEDPLEGKVRLGGPDHELPTEYNAEFDALGSSNPFIRTKFQVAQECPEFADQAACD